VAFYSDDEARTFDLRVRSNIRLMIGLILSAVSSPPATLRHRLPRRVAIGGAKDFTPDISAFTSPWVASTTASLNSPDAGSPDRLNAIAPAFFTASSLGRIGVRRFLRFERRKVDVVVPVERYDDV
jgi:hypothetical protein